MKNLVALLALVTVSAAAAAPLTPSVVVQLVTQKTTLIAEGSPACNAVEKKEQASNWPNNPSAQFKFIKTYKYTYPSVLGAVPKMELNNAVAAYSDLKWMGSSWNPWRNFETVGIPETSSYLFQVQVIEPEFEDYGTTDYTSVCITVLAFRPNK